MSCDTSMTEILFRHLSDQHSAFLLQLQNSYCKYQCEFFSIPTV